MFTRRTRSLALLLGMSVAVLSMVAQSPEATVDSGRMKGTRSGSVESFKGIPFALPPTGNLRWRAPQAFGKWQDVRAADNYAPDCMQMPFPSDAAPLGTKPAEDCLYLNVWRPAGAKPGAKLPVMVWIYGGGFVNGGSSPSVYDGSKFAEKGVVFISFNYRLGRFGFFGFPALTAENADGMLGNYGFMDQIAALKWVQRNAGSLGGDPAQVTVFGESAGGFSVNMLLTSSMAEGLFSKAIVESGGGRTNLNGQRYLTATVPNGPESAESIGIKFARSAGISGTDHDALTALRALPAETVRADLNMSNSRTSLFSGPMVDGKIVVADPQAILLSGGGAKVPIIIGANSADIGRVTGDTKEALFSPFGSMRPVAEAAYDPDNHNPVAEIRTKLSMDRMMVEPARFIASIFASNGVPSFEYRFSYVAESMRKEWSGAPHATEIPFVFDTVAARYGARLAPADEAIARKMLSYWVAFAKTGDPSNGDSPAWPRYSPASDMLINFTDRGAVAEHDRWKSRLDVTQGLVTTSAPPVSAPTPAK